MVWSHQLEAWLVAACLWNAQISTVGAHRRQQRQSPSKSGRESPFRAPGLLLQKAVDAPGLSLPLLKGHPQLLQPALLSKCSL